MPIAQQSNKVVLTHPSGASAEVHLYGATLTSWNVHGKERIFVSQKAILDGSKAIRGGIPLVFPVFGKSKPPHVTSSLPQHGFARISRWKFINAQEDGGVVVAQFGLNHTMLSAENRAAWPYDFELIFTVRLHADKLETHLKVHNIGDKPFEFNTLLHTYFSISDASKVQVSGLSGLEYVDKVSQSTKKQEGDVTIPGEVDSVYANVQSQTIEIKDVAAGDAAKGIRLARDGINDIVVWNPWVEKAKGMADFGDAEYTNMICVEAGQVAEFLGLQAGKAWEGGQILSLL
ncbi:hypothetical protein BGZ73_006452 [Actinomortierella ambigua]|nr:hypothetical protein BGZ73_006452 [Actinomortierella ambigua]